MATPAVTENVKCHDICHLFTDSTKHQSRLYFWSNNVFFRVRGYSMCSDNSTQENGLGVSVPQRSPLHKEIVRYGVEDRSSHWETVSPLCKCFPHKQSQLSLFPEFRAGAPLHTEERRSRGHYTAPEKTPEDEYISRKWHILQDYTRLLISHRLCQN